MHIDQPAEKIKPNIPSPRPNSLPFLSPAPKMITFNMKNGIKQSVTILNITSGNRQIGLFYIVRE